METLKQQLQGIAKEYARQTGQLLGTSRYDWLGIDGTFALCEFSESFWFTLDELQVIIDNIDKWVKLYGSREKVAAVIREWQEWWMCEICEKHKVSEVDLGRARRLYAPNRNLLSWLMGYQEEEDTTHGTVLLDTKLTVARELVNDFGPNDELQNVVAGLQYELDMAKQSEKANQDALNEALANGTAPDKLQRAYDEFHSKIDEI